MGGDDAKRIVLLRRAKFVAAALAGATAATACGTDPQPCLSIAVDGSTPPPQPCLTPTQPPPQPPPPQPCLSPPMDAGDAGDAADADEGG